jgi:hypothetical protein
VALDEEVVGSRRDLDEMGFVRPRLLAYPYGDHDGRTFEAARAAGYEAAFTTVPEVARRDGPPFAVPRIEVSPHDVGLRLLRKVRRGGPEGELELWIRRRWAGVRRRLSRVPPTP